MTETQRLRAAFAAELEPAPDSPPGPTALSRRMGLTGRSNNLNGRLSALRAQLLIEAGFHKTDEPPRGRWRRDGGGE